MHRRHTSLVRISQHGLRFALRNSVPVCNSHSTARSPDCCLNSSPWPTCKGGIHPIEEPWENRVELESLPRFAVEEHNKKENSAMKFARLVNARDQMVAGKLYYFTLEANGAGKNKVYEAKVWVKPWMKFKQLQEFKVSDDQEA